MSDLHVCSGGSRFWNKGGGGGWSSGPLAKEGAGGSLQKFFFRPFGPQFGLKIRGGGEADALACVLINVRVLFLHISGWCFHGVLHHVSCNGWSYYHLLQYRDFWAQQLWRLLRLRLWARLLQLSWKDGHSCHNAYPGHYCIWGWNLGSNMCLSNEAMRLLRTTAGKSGISSFILKMAQKFQSGYPAAVIRLSGCCRCNNCTINKINK